MTPESYLALEAALKAIGIPCAENGWTTRPAEEFLTYALEYEADADHADNRKTVRSWEGSIDYYSRAKRGDPDVTAAIEGALDACCEACWRCETRGRWEPETDLFHFEWVFQCEG